MNYQRIYNEFIADRKAKEAALIASGEYKEKHHIIPRSMGGTDEPENLIFLTAGDHFLAHYHYAEWKGGIHWHVVSVWACWDASKNNERKISVEQIKDYAELYEKASKLASENQSIRMKSMYGDEDFAEYMRRVKKAGQQTPEYKVKAGKAQVARYNREGERQRMGEISKFVQQNPEVKNRHKEGLLKRWDNEEKRKIQSETLTKVKNLPEEKAKSSVKAKEVWRREGFREAHAISMKKAMTPEVRERRGELLSKAKRQKPLAIVNLDTGQEFYNQFEAHEWVMGNGKRPCKSRGDLLAVCRGKLKTAGGYRWAYA